MLTPRNRGPTRRGQGASPGPIRTPLPNGHRNLLSRCCDDHLSPGMISSLQWRAAALLVLGVIASTALPPALAQTYPTKPVQLVVAFQPGGVGDLVARAVSDKLARALGQPVNVENRPRSAGLIGTQSVMGAAPDGYTLLAGQTTEIVVNGALGAELPGEPEKPLKPIALFAVMPLALAVPAGAPYASPDDLVKAAGASRRGLSFASGDQERPGTLPPNSCGREPRAGSATCL